MTTFAAIKRKEQLSEQLLNVCMQGNLNEARRLVEEGADVNVMTGGGIIHVVGKNDKPMILFLLEKGIDVNCLDGMFFIKEAKSGRVDTVQYMLKAGANLKWYGSDAIIGAAQNGHKEVVQLLFEAGVRIDDVYAINKAITYGHPDTFELLKPAFEFEEDEGQYEQIQKAYQERISGN